MRTLFWAGIAAMILAMAAFMLTGTTFADVQVKKLMLGVFMLGGAAALTGALGEKE